MKKYVALYYAPWEAMKQMATMTEEQKKEGMKGWMDWMEKYKDNLIDGGSPLMPAISLSTDNQWGQSSKEVTGYSVISAANEDELKKMFDGHPHLSWYEGCTVEISEFAPM